jgi:hypothetical protein
MSKIKATRRMFLRGAAGAVLAVPMLGRFEGRRAIGAAPTKRIVFVYIPQNETDGMLPKSGFSLAGTYLEPLAPYAAKTTVIYGAKGASGHQGGHSEHLTGFPSPSFESWAPTQGPSIDQLIATRMGNVTTMPSLHLTLQSKERASRNDGTISWTASKLAVPPMSDPYQAFLKVFGNPTGANPTDAAAARQRALKTSVLDALMADYGRVNKKLDASDRLLLDEHLTLLRQQEQKLATMPSFSCSMPGTAPPNRNPPSYDSGNWPQKSPEQIGVLTSALRCDATRVATFMLGFSQETTPHSWAGNDTDFHTVAHDSNKPNYFNNHFLVRKWQYGQVAALAQSLAAAPDPSGSGTLLDSTTIVCMSELGLITAADEAHSRAGVKGVGAVIIGDAGGFFKPGRVVDLGGTSYHNLLLTLVHAMGYTDVAKVGSQGTTVLTALRG